MACEYSDALVAQAILAAYFVVTIIMSVLVMVCTKKKENDKYAGDRIMLTNYIGKFPIFSFLFSFALLCVGTGLAFFNPCFEMRTFTIDKNTENYIKSSNPDTDNYDALGAAIMHNDDTFGWPYRRRSRNLLSALGGLGSFPDDGCSDFMCLDNIGFEVLDEEVRRTDAGVLVTHARCRTIKNQVLTQLVQDLGRTSRRLSSKYKRQKSQLTFVYAVPGLGETPGNIFTNQNMLAINSFENEIKNLPEYTTFCRKESYYTKNSGDIQCAKQASAVTSWFFETSADGSVQSLLNVDDTLRSMAENGIFSFMDVYFSLNYRQSNLTRSTYNFDYQGKESAYEKFLTEKLVPLARSSQNKNFRVLYFAQGYLFDWEVDSAVVQDAKWSALSFLSVLVFVWLHTRSVIISVRK